MFAKMIKKHRHLGIGHRYLAAAAMLCISCSQGDAVDHAAKSQPLPDATTAAQSAAEPSRENSWPQPGPTTPLHVATKDNNIETIREAISTADINARDEDGGTAVAWASAYGHTEALRILIEGGADVNIPTSDDISPLHLAAQYGELDACEILLDNGAILDSKSTGGLGATPLYTAMIYDQIAVATFLIKKGADVNAEGASSTVPNTPLAIAAWKEQADLLDLLLSVGARDPWLSEVPGFDPYSFSPVTPGMYEGGEIRVGSLPFFLARHSVRRPWQKPTESSGSRTGNDFLRWAGDSKHESGQSIMLIAMEDSAGNATSVMVVPPLYLGASGVAYPQGMSTIAEGGHLPASD